MALYEFYSDGLLSLIYASMKAFLEASQDA